MARASDAIQKLTWLFAAAVCAFTAENIWIDRWLERKSHHKLPSFVPEAPGGKWFLILLALVITVILLVVCQVLLMRDRTLPKRKKLVTGMMVAAAALLSGAWLVKTGGAALGMRSAADQAGQREMRSVVLRWQPSTTPGVRYNIFRGPFPDMYPDRVNDAPIEGTSFTDTTAVRGETYWYIVRAITDKRDQSPPSNVARVTVP